MDRLSWQVTCLRVNSRSGLRGINHVQAINISPFHFSSCSGLVLPGGKGLGFYSNGSAAVDLNWGRGEQAVVRLERVCQQSRSEVCVVVAGWGKTQQKTNPTELHGSTLSILTQ